MAQRRDPSSLSFGARLHSVEQAAATNAKRVSELEELAQSKQQKQEADAQRKYRRAERRRATSMLPAFDTSLEQLQSVDRSALTTAQAFLPGCWHGLVRPGTPLVAARVRIVV